jgi:phage terminase large subunit
MNASLDVIPYLRHSISVVHRPIFKDRNRILLVYGGAGSGKSHAIAEKILFRMIYEKESHKILIVRKVATTLLNSVWALVMLKLEAWNIRNLVKINITNKRMEVNGNVLIFTGLDNVEKLKSIEGITSIWVEEASELLQSDFDQLDTRLRGVTKYYKQIILSFNPINLEHWIKKTLVDNKPSNASIYHSTYLDNKHIDDDYKQVFERLKETNLAYYNVYALGNWGVYEGVIFDRWKQIKAVPRGETWDFQGYGIDFGFTVASSVIACFIKGKTLILDELIYQSQLTNSDLIGRMKQLGSELKGVGYADSAEPDRILEITRAGFKCYPANKSNKLDRIDFFKSFDIQVTARSTNLIKELNTYIWGTDRNGNQLDEPVKINDHAIDASLYVVYTQHNPTPSLRRFSQVELGF